MHVWFHRGVGSAYWRKIHLQLYMKRLMIAEPVVMCGVQCSGRAQVSGFSIEGEICCIADVACKSYYSARWRQSQWTVNVASQKISLNLCCLSSGNLISIEMFCVFTFFLLFTPMGAEAGINAEMFQVQILSTRPACDLCPPTVQLTS